MDSLLVDPIEMDNKIKKMVMQNETSLSCIKDITSCFSELEKCYKSLNSKNIELNNINSKKNFKLKFEERQNTIREIKTKMEIYKQTDKEVTNLFTRGIK